MNETPHIFDTQMYTDQKAKYRKLAEKIGIAMIALVLNNRFAPYVFVILAALFSGGAELSYSTIMIINEFSAYLFPVIILTLMFSEECAAFVPDKSYTHIDGEAFWLFSGGMTLGAVGTIVTKLINSAIDSIFGTGEIEEAFAGMEPQNMGEFGVFAFCICIVAPIAEEYIFRNLLLKPLRAYNDLSAALITGIVFGLYHGNFDQFAYAAILGTFYSIIAVRYNSIVPTVILHAANNIIVTFANYLPAACGNADPQIKAICDSIASVCSTASLCLMVCGIVGVIVCAASKVFYLNNHNRYIPQGKSLVYFISTPLVLIGIAVMFIPFFID